MARPIQYERDADGYLPIEGYGVIGNGRTLALVGADGSIDWCSFPRVDDPSVFGRILDARKGGYWQIAPDEGWTATRSYLDNTNVLVTEFSTDNGVVELIDFMPTIAFASDMGLSQRLWDGVLIRFVRGVRGSVRMRQDLTPGFNYAREETEIEMIPGHGVIVAGQSSALRVVCSVPLQAATAGLQSMFTIDEGQGAYFSISYHGTGSTIWADISAEDARDLLDRDIEGWQRWISRCSYDGPYAACVRRSALALKLLDYLPTGAVVAAATTSLPENIGGIRNWDYRYSWIRDSSYAIHALSSIGYRGEAEGFLQWVIDVTKHDPSALQIMYRVDGGQDLEEICLDHLDGYKHSRPVRIGNAAYQQRQLDRFGEVIDAAWVHHRFGGVINAALWDYIVEVADVICDRWRLPDAGIWEVRSSPRRMTYSNVMCWVGLDRAVRMAEIDNREGPIDHWREVRDRIREDIMTYGVSQDGVFTQSFEGDILDASALTFPLRSFIDVDHPIMEATIEAVERELTVDGLVARYRSFDSMQNVDGLPGEEGRFILCSFWLINCLIGLGKLDRAQELLEKMLDRTNDLGLYSEEIRGDTGAFLGNFPQAFSHIGVINSIVDLARARGEIDHTPDKDYGDITGAIPEGPETRRLTGRGGA